MNFQAVRYHATGTPQEVLQFETLPLPELAPTDALVELEMAVIHPSDLGMINGTYGRLRELPAIAGREGIGRITKLGEAVSFFKIGDRVKMPEDAGVWREKIACDAKKLRSVPLDLPAEQACMAFINPPTALLLLTEFTTLNAGDWIIQNAANSAVGECVIQLAKHFGIHTANLVRNPEKHGEKLKAIGATLVVADDKDALKKILPEMKKTAAKLALNSIGGPSAITLTRALDDNGILVTFGGMTGDMIRFPTREFIFKNITYRGFWMDRMARTMTPEKLDATFGAIYNHLKNGTLKMAIDSIFPLENFQDAIARAANYSRDGKVLLKGKI